MVLILIGLNPRAIRTELRCNEFNKWKELRQRGIGVLWYGSCTATNAWVSNKGGLSSGEWTNAIKASMNSMSNRGTGGRSVGNPHCRNLACNENNIIETLPHIRGSCPKTELLRNNAHHKVRTILANLFRAKNLEVHEEVCCVAVDEGAAQNRRADIIVVDRRKGRGLILDPTIRWETNDEQQDVNVHEEKRGIYLPCTSNLSNVYGVREWEVFGLWFGARRTASKLLLDFFKNHGLQRRDLEKISKIS
ncbi:hypothetical protein ACI65C_009921 [Semiaphis heraclei]